MPGVCHRVVIFLVAPLLLVLGIAAGSGTGHAQPLRQVLHEDASVCEIRGALRLPPGPDCPQAARPMSRGLQPGGSALGGAPPEDKYEREADPEVTFDGRPGQGIPVNLTFDLNSARLRPSARAFLDNLARVMNEAPEAAFSVIGHTDASGPLPFNMRLSTQRAQSVIHYLADANGVARPRLRADGKGPNQPLPGRDRFDAENRRVTIYTHPPRGSGG